MRKRLIIGIALAIIGVWAAIDGLWLEPQSLTLTALDVQTPAWPQKTAPLRAVLLSDIHVDPVHMTPTRVRDVVSRANALHPDIIFLAGDYIGGDWLTLHRSRKLAVRNAADNARETEGFKALGGLSAPLGVYAVLGNHDCWWSCERARDLLIAQNIHVLINQSARVARPGGDVWIIGMADKTTQVPDFPAAFLGVPPRAGTITLLHEPDPFAHQPEDTLQLSGHTHAGQVRLPLIGAPIRNSRYQEEAAKGWLIRDGRILVVTRGLGESGLPVRLGAPPQIMLLTIHSGSSAHVVASKDQKLQ